MFESPARTNRLLVRLLTDEDQERSTFHAHGKVVAASLRATPLSFGGVGNASDPEDISGLTLRITNFMLQSVRG